MASGWKNFGGDEVMWNKSKESKLKTRKKVLWIIVVLALSVYLFPVVQNRFAFARSRPSAHEAAPDFLLKALAGKDFHLSDYKGKVVLVNFFASWCPPCKMEIPGFEKIYMSHKDRGFVVVGIALDEVTPSFIQKMGITYPVVAANDNVISDYGSVSSIPVSFLVGKDGRIIKKISGMYFEPSMKNDVESALKGRN
jgi:cytochrome c biogenesis protein CcmG, thiol:disulfide interchange protein DsbE